MASTTLEKNATTPRATGEPVLEIEGLNISFFVRAGEIPAVMDFSCKVMPGETMGLVGESGCGKSTVALGIMRDMGNRGKIVGGSIKFKGRDMGEMSDAELRDLRGSKIAMIYQEPMASLNPAMRIGKQLMEVPIIHEQVSETEAYDRALEMLESVKLPDPKRVMEAYPHQISGGQQQRIVIAMALLSKPDLLLLDEPTTALDVTVEAGIVELVKELGRKTGTSMLFISHNLGLILETCDRITVMYSGEAVETGTVHEVFDRMRHPYTQGLFNSIPLPGADKNSKPLISIPGQLPLPMERPRGCNFGPRCRFFDEAKCNAGPVFMNPVPGEADHRSRCTRIEEIDWNNEPARKVVEQPSVPGDTVLEINDLKKYYDVAANKMFGGGDTRTVKANESITFTAREAETVAIVGESGCGKSTLAKVLLGLETATAGEVLLDGKDIGSTKVQDRNKRTVASVQMVFQNPFDTLNPSHSVGSQIIRTLEKFGMGDSDADRKERMLKLLDLVKLPRAFAERMPRQLSGGQKQRIGVARAFAGEPRVVVADEPVSALDVSVQAAVTELLMDIQREARTTMLFISHDLSIVRYIADRVVVMYLGHIVEQGTTDDIFSPPYHPYTEALLSAIPIADTSVSKKHIVLDGDIPSAMNPPSGCPFQTRCPRKSQVPGTLCETDVPPVRTLANGHEIKCHLAADILDQMEPVIVLGNRDMSGSDFAMKTAGSDSVGDGGLNGSTDKATTALSSDTSATSAAAGVGLVTGGAAALAGLSGGAEPVSKPAANKRLPEDTVNTKGRDGSGITKPAAGDVAAKTGRKPSVKAKAAPAKAAAPKAATVAKATGTQAGKTASKPTASKATPSASVKPRTTSASRTGRAAPTTKMAVAGSTTLKAKSAAKAKAANRAALAAAVRGKSDSKAKPKAASSKKPAKAATAKAKVVAQPSKPEGFVKIRKPKAPDDLKMVSGIGPKIEGILNGMGVYTFEQVSKWKKADREWVNAELSFKGRIEREDWVKQARALAKGGEAEYIKVFGKKPR